MLGIPTSYQFQTTDMAELAIKGYWTEIEQMSKYMNQIKINLYFVTNQYDDFMKMLTDGIMSRSMFGIV